MNISDQQPIYWDAGPVTMLLICLRAEPALRHNLGLGECKSFLAALEQGIGTEDRSALKQLLTQLLVKKEGDEKAVSSALKAFFNLRIRQILQKIPKEVLKLWSEFDAGQWNIREEVERLRLMAEEEEGKNNPFSANDALEVVSQVQFEVTLTASEIGVQPEIDATTTQHQTALSHPYILSDDYQPISVRKMEQMWRFLRKPIRANTVMSAFDMPRTVERLARQGWLDEPVWQRDKTNKVRLVLLIDHTGSMTAWHSLARQLLATARSSGIHKYIEVRWMHNLPYSLDPKTKQGTLFKDQSRLQAEPLADLLRRCSQKNTEVVIFSDGGAARGRLNLGRATTTADFIGLLRCHVSSVAWLNPMPSNRWWGSTAEIIAHRVRMFETTPRGFMSMINQLRGHL